MLSPVKCVLLCAFCGALPAQGGWIPQQVAERRLELRQLWAGGAEAVASRADKLVAAIRAGGSDGLAVWRLLDHHGLLLEERRSVAQGLLESWLVAPGTVPEHPEKTPKPGSHFSRGWVMAWVAMDPEASMSMLLREPQMPGWVVRAALDQMVLGQWLAAEGEVGRPFQLPASGLLAECLRDPRPRVAEGAVWWGAFTGGSETLGFAEGYAPLGDPARSVLLRLLAEHPRPDLAGLGVVLPPGDPNRTVFARRGASDERLQPFQRALWMAHLAPGDWNADLARDLMAYIRDGDGPGRAAQWTVVQAAVQRLPSAVADQQVPRVHQALEAGVRPELLAPLVGRMSDPGKDQLVSLAMVLGGAAEEWLVSRLAADDSPVFQQRLGEILDDSAEIPIPWLRYAGRALAGHGDRTERLLRALSEADPTRAVLAFEALLRAGVWDPRWVRYAGGSASDDPYQRWSRVQQEVVRSRDPMVRESILTGLLAGDREAVLVALRICRDLAGSGPGGGAFSAQLEALVLEATTSALADGQREAATTGLQGLAIGGQPATLAEVWERLGALPTGRRIRFRAVFLKPLCRDPSPDALPVLRRAAAMPTGLDHAVRMSVLVALARLGEPDVLGPLFEQVAELTAAQLVELRPLLADAGRDDMARFAGILGDATMGDAMRGECARWLAARVDLDGHLLLARFVAAAAKDPDADEFLLDDCRQLLAATPLRTPRIERLLKRIANPTSPRDRLAGPDMDPAFRLLGAWQPAVDGVLQVPEYTDLEGALIEACLFGPGQFHPNADLIQEGRLRPGEIGLWQLSRLAVRALGASGPEPRAIDRVVARADQLRRSPLRLQLSRNRLAAVLFAMLQSEPLAGGVGGAGAPARAALARLILAIPRVAGGHDGPAMVAQWVLAHEAADAGRWREAQLLWGQVLRGALSEPFPHRYREGLLQLWMPIAPQSAASTDVWGRLAVQHHLCFWRAVAESEAGSPPPQTVSQPGSRRLSMAAILSSGDATARAEWADILAQRNEDR